MNLIVTNKNEVSKLLKGNSENELLSKIEELKTKIAESEDFKMIKQLESELQELREDKKCLLDLIQENMINKELKEHIEQGIKFKLKKREGSLSVDVTNLEEIPKEYIRIKKEADKKAIQKAIKEDGELVPGAELKKGPTTYTLDVEIVEITKEDIMLLGGK